MVLFCRPLKFYETLFRQNFFEFRRNFAVGRNASRNFYDVLGVKPTASEKEIKTKYYELSKKYHPDTHKTTDATSALKRFQEVGLAYETLGNKAKRKSYDISLRGTASSTSTPHSDYDADENDEVFRNLKRSEQIRQNYRHRGKASSAKSDFEAYQRRTASSQYDEMKRRPSSTASDEASAQKRSAFDEAIGRSFQFREFDRPQENMTEFQREMWKRQQLKNQQEFFDNLIKSFQIFAAIFVVGAILTTLLGR